MKAGWKTEPLGDLCEFQRGLTYAKSDEVDVSDNVVLRATNIDLTTNLLDFAELKYINDKVVVPDSKKVKKGSLIICTASGSKSHLGKVAYIDDDFGYAFGGFMGMITPKNGLVPKYLFHLMTSDAYKDFIGELSDGANINNLKFDDLKKFQVPHPKRDEQKRIIGILDKAFESIATAKANAEKNLQNTRALFESYLQDIFTQRGPGWEEKPLGECVQDISTGPFGSLLHKSDYERGGIPLVNPINIEGEEIIPNKNKAVGIETAKRLASYTLRENDIVIARRGEIGRCAVITRNQAGWICGTGCFIIRSSEKTDPHFLTHLLRSKPYRAQLEGVSERATMPSISNGDLQKLVIGLPTIPQQRHILSLLDNLSTETQRLAIIYQSKLAALEILKKSLLHQAFNGNL